jgi:hypothetical protein
MDGDLATVSVLQQHWPTTRRVQAEALKAWCRAI